MLDVICIEVCTVLKAEGVVPTNKQQVRYEARAESWKYGKPVTSKQIGYWLLAVNKVYTHNFSFEHSLTTRNMQQVNK